MSSSVSAKPQSRKLVVLEWREAGGGETQFSGVFCQITWYFLKIRTNV